MADSITFSDSLIGCSLLNEETITTSQLATSQMIQSFCPQAVDGYSLCGMIGASLFASIARVKCSQVLSLFIQDPKKAYLIKGGSAFAACLAEATGIHSIPKILKEREILSGRVEEGWGGWIHTSLTMIIMKGSGIVLPPNLVLQHLAQDALMVKLDEVCVSFHLIEGQQGSFIEKLASAEVMSCQMMVSGALIGICFSEIKMYEAKQDLKYVMRQRKSWKETGFNQTAQAAATFASSISDPLRMNQFVTSEGVEIRLNDFSPTKNIQEKRNQNTLFMTGGNGETSRSIDRTERVPEKDRIEFKQKLLRKKKEGILAEFRQFDEEPEILIYERAHRLFPIVRSLLKDSEVGMTCLEIYHGLSKQFDKLSGEEVEAGSCSIFSELQEHRGESAQTTRLEILERLSRQWTTEKPPISPKAFRECWEQKEEFTEFNQRIYSQLILSIKAGELEVWEGSAALLKELTRTSDDPRLADLIFKNYTAISKLFDRTNKTHLLSEFASLAQLLPALPPFTRSLVIDYLTELFKNYRQQNLWGEMIPPWLKSLGFPADAQMVFMKRVVYDKQGISFLTYWETLIRFLYLPDMSRVRIVTSLLKSNGKLKEIYSGIAALLLIPEYLREDLFFQIAQQIEKWPAEASSTSPGRVSRLNTFVKSCLIESMAEQIRQDPSKPRSWETKKEHLLHHLTKDGILDLFLRAAHFMRPEGKQILGAFLDDLADCPVEKGEINYWKKYQRMVDSGFSLPFTQTWARTFYKTIQIQTPQNREESRAIIFRQAEFCITGRLSKVTKRGKLSSLVQTIYEFTLKLREGSPSIELEIDAIIDSFKEHYQEISSLLGKDFLEIKHDLVNLKNSIQLDYSSFTGKHSLSITGKYSEIAKGGHIPVERCQTLLRLWLEETNGRGQPLERLRHGKFKMAYYSVNDKPVARHLLEVNRDEMGETILFVYPLYANEKFLWGEGFKNEIENYALEIGIPKTRIRFHYDDWD